MLTSGKQRAYYLHMPTPTSDLPNLTPGAKALLGWLARMKLDQRAGAQVLGVHYMSLNQILRGKRKPGLAVALRIERHTGLPAGIWLRTAVSGTKRRKSDTSTSTNKHAAYDYAR